MPFEMNEICGAQDVDGASACVLLVCMQVLVAILHHEHVGQLHTDQRHGTGEGGHDPEGSSPA